MKKLILFCLLFCSTPTFAQVPSAESVRSNAMTYALETCAERIKKAEALGIREITIATQWDDTLREKIEQKLSSSGYSVNSQRIGLNVYLTIKWNQ